jgi:hypothetical protein
MAKPDVVKRIDRLNLPCPHCRKVGWHLIGCPKAPKGTSRLGPGKGPPPERLLPR